MKTEKILSKFFLVTTVAQVAFYSYRFVRKLEEKDKLNALKFAKKRAKKKIKKKLKK